MSLLKLLTDTQWCVYLALVIPFQHLSWLAPPAASLLQSAKGSWIQYCRISLSLLETSDTWGKRKTENVFIYFTHWLTINSLKSGETLVHKIVISTEVVRPLGKYEWCRWTHLHLQSESRSRWRFVLRGSQGSALPPLLMSGGSSCPWFPWSSTCLVYLQTHIKTQL